jgi:ubiquinone/menaquinone biosynthesis C-methylase UbiE
MSPQQTYRARLLQEVATFEPTSILEVGCGKGALLQAARSLQATVHGIDVDSTAVQGLARAGYSASVGSAEKLSLEDGSWDVVVFVYTAHHIANWSQALAEAMRCCRRAVVILDPWYDTAVPSQAVALAFDRWSKKIDRSNGMVHNDRLSIAGLLGDLLLSNNPRSIRIEYLLTLSPFGLPSSRY